MSAPLSADVAELADAQVSEACDGDIVEVQVLSSAPKLLGGEPNWARRFCFLGGPETLKKVATEPERLVFSY